MDSFIQSLTTLPLLEKFELGMRLCPHNYLQAEESWATLANLTALRVLRLNGSLEASLPWNSERDRPFSDIFIAALQENNENSKLEVLDVAHNHGLTSITSQEICEAIATHRNLKVLDMNHNQQNDRSNFQGISIALQQNGILQTLNLSSNYIKDDGAKAIAELIRCERSALKKIFLDNSRIESEGLLCIARALEHNDKLILLSARDNDLADDVGLAFATALMKNRTLEYLDLRTKSSKIDRPTCEAFLSMFQHNTVLRFLDLPYRGPKYARQIRTFLLLNQKGRGQLLEDLGNRREWLKCLSFFSYKQDALHYLVRMNPSMCQILHG
jgi:Ran GTPase-activating protein (RanGAP) involved in mRNA processing and transport